MERKKINVENGLLLKIIENNFAQVFASKYLLWKQGETHFSQSPTQQDEQS